VLEVRLGGKARRRRRWAKYNIRRHGQIKLGAPFDRNQRGRCAAPRKQGRHSCLLALLVRTPTRHRARLQPHFLMFAIHVRLFGGADWHRVFVVNRAHLPAAAIRRKLWKRVAKHRQEQHKSGKAASDPAYSTDARTKAHCRLKFCHDFPFPSTTSWFSRTARGFHRISLCRWACRNSRSFLYRLSGAPSSDQHPSRKPSNTGPCPLPSRP
jgi:hypothetical protein